MDRYTEDGNFIIEKQKDFILSQTLECGQCFHFVKLDEEDYLISAKSRILHIAQKENRTIFYNTDEQTFDKVWKHYFDLERDYGKIKSILIEKDDRLATAIEAMSGVRILNQEFFETLISFIISQNKQIPHIKQIVARISHDYGKYQGSVGGIDFYGFPTPQQLSQADIDALRECKTGFRAPYIYNAVEFVNNEIIKEVVDGGFAINEEYSSSKLYELAKMDGAIILSGDLKRILFANAQLIPSREIETRETGTRHRTAERTAKQTGELVISISQRRNIITIFKGNDRYILEDTDVVLNKANQGVQTLERYKKVFDNKLSILNEYEFNDIVTLENVIVAIQRAEMVMRIVEDIQSQIYELGNDGRLVKMQLEELIGGVEKEELLIIKDYLAVTKKKKTPETVMEELSEIPYEELTKQVTVAKLLGYENFDNYDEVGVYTRGYRILSKIPRMPSNIVENLVLSYKSFQHILAADIESLDEVDGIGEVRARTIKQSLRRMQEQFVFDNLVL